MKTVNQSNCPLLNLCVMYVVTNNSLAMLTMDAFIQLRGSLQPKNVINASDKIIETSTKYWNVVTVIKNRQVSLF